MSNPSVLIVEDEPAIRGMLISALRREPLRVETAADGLEALEKARQRDYAVIVVDLMMPRMDGFDFVAALRPLRRNGRPIVIVMTASDEPALRRLESDDVHGFLRKPFDVGMLVDVVRDCADAVQEAETGSFAPPWLLAGEDSVC